MVSLRDKVIQADQANGNTEEALRNLRIYVYSHMNTNLVSGQNSIKPPLQLKYSYDRAQSDEQARVTTEKSKIYTDAQDYCQKQLPQSFSGGPRVPCITSYVTSHNVKANLVDSSLYKFDFTSPTWSPDLAGWSLVLAGLSLSAYIVLFIANRPRIRN